DFRGDSFFLEPHRFLDGDFIERVHAHFNIGQLDAGTVRLDADFHVEIDDALDRNQDFHACLPPVMRSSANTAIAAPWHITRKTISLLPYFLLNSPPLAMANIPVSRMTTVNIINAKRRIMPKLMRRSHRGRYKCANNSRKSRGRPCHDRYADRRADGRA